ncbi:MAG: nucleotidyltransferase family protein [Pseudomonadales bacterium]|nr:nucleotidyltransferase family protein [Pseudomonadales bacterium]MCP5329578.1 nucleotidyltransferase family protein [Pseudomonadales bacterium]MCP5343883.1 nucleotidyltransferase family protein [Pseudomonadales bacterium]
MKAIILAAGLGTRMRPLTDTLPKPLLQAGGQALIEYHLHNLVRAGITDIVINHYHLGEKLEAALGDGSRYGARIQYSRETVRLETAGGIVKALPLLGDEAFAVISGDIWTDFDYCHLRPVDGETTLARLLMVHNPEHHQHGDFSLRPDGRLALKAPEAEDGLTYAGISVMHPRLFANLPEAPLALRPVLDAAIAAGHIEAEQYTGQWFDIGTPERLAELDTLLRNG